MGRGKEVGWHILLIRIIPSEIKEKAMRDTTSEEKERKGLRHGRAVSL
jgi:hypothetical protein